MEQSKVGAHEKELTNVKVELATVRVCYRRSGYSFIFDDSIETACLEIPPPPRQLFR